MSRRSLLLVCVCLLGAFTLGAQAQMVIVNGQKVAVPMIVKDGKAYVDFAALATLLGVTANFDATTSKLYINTTPAAAPAKPTGGATSAAAAGTAQLPGDNGEIGKVYAMGKGGSTLYFTLTRAEYVADRIVIGDHLGFPTADEKFLVIHFTLQNPQNQDFDIDWASVRFTVVDANNTNHEYASWMGDERNKASLHMALKPAQKVEAYAYFRVPAAGVVPKLMVLPAEDGPVLRYDLRGKVTPLPAPVADPADDTGATALAEAPMKIGGTCAIGAFDIKVEQMEIVDTPIDKEKEAEEGMRYAVFTIATKNMSPERVDYDWGSFTALLTSTDGEEFEWSGPLLLEKVSRELRANLAPGQESRGRLYFTIPQDVTPGKLKLWNSIDNTHSYIVDLAK